jgi:hypothetical protein
MTRVLPSQDQFPNLGDDLVTQHVLLCLMVNDWWIWTRVRQEQPFRTINKRSWLIRNVIRDPAHDLRPTNSASAVLLLALYPRPPFSQRLIVLYSIDTLNTFR